MNPFHRRMEKAGSGVHGVTSEKFTSKRLGARQQMFSGATPAAKGDMQLSGFLIEAKSTIKESLSLPLNWLAKITGEAHARNKVPALTVTFVTGDGRPREDGTWVMVPEEIFKELLNGTEAT